MASIPSGISLPGVTRAPPATLARTPLPAPSRTNEPLSIKPSSPSHAAWDVEFSPMAGYRDDRRRGCFESSDIGGRHLYIDRERFRPDESVDELSDRFRRGSLELGEAALRSALDRAGWRPEDVDFVATTTCTGRMTPSLDAHMVARLGCRPDVQPVHVGDTR